MMDYAEWKKTVLNKGYDIDNSYGCQCWDLYAKWCVDYNVPICHCTRTGYVRDIYEMRKTNGILKYCHEVSVMEPGDIVIFKVTPGVTPYSHIAFFDHDAGNGQGWFLGQNQGAPGGRTNLVCLPYSATYEYALRPIAYNTASSGKPAVYEWDKDAVLEVGDIVKSGSCAITGVYEDYVGVVELDADVHLRDLGEASNSKDGAVDGYLANTKAKVYLKQCEVTAVDAAKNLVKVKGRNTGLEYWIKPDVLSKRI